MPTYSIQGPDGKTYSIDGPAGVTREQVIAKIKEKQPQLAAAPAPQPPPPQQQPDQRRDLATTATGNPRALALMRQSGEKADPNMMARFGMGVAAPFVGFAQKGADLIFGEGGQADQAAKAFNDARERLAQRSGIKPGQTNVADLAGQVASPANYAGGGLVRGAGVLARVGKAALAGGFSGATQPDSSDQPLRNAANGAKTGAEIGAALGAGGEMLGASLSTGYKAAKAAIAEKEAGLAAAFKAGASVIANDVTHGAKAIYSFLARTPGEDAVAHNTAVAKILARHENDAAGGGPTATQAIAAVNEARARGAPMALADVSGKNVRRLAGSVSRAPGAAPQMAEGFARQQLEGASKRLSDLVGENIASGPTMRKTADALTVGQKAEAAPLYAEAFKPGSVAPLKAQFEGEFNRVSRDAKEAAEAVSAAQRDMIQAQAKVSRAGDNVYSANVALRARAEAQQALKEAQAKAIAARTESQQVLSRLREAQSAEAAGQRGGVWSPRIQQFLNDPTLKPAIARGMEIQRLEALAEGRPFNPHDFSITGEEKDGSPIIGKVPNMRLLDAVKKGIDDMLEHYRSDITGKLVLDERGRALDQVRRSYIKTLDELNPDYSKARAAWAGPAQAKGTMGLGSKHLSRNVEENEKIWSGLSPSDRQFYLIGVADHLRDEIAKKGVTSPMVNALKEGSHNSRIKEQLRMLFSDQAKFDQFLKSVTDERTIFEKAGERLRGSQTAERLGADEENGLAAGAHALAAGAKVVNGHWAGAIQSLVAAKRDLGIIGDKKVNDALAKLLFDPSIDLNGPVGLRLIGRIPVAQAKAMSYVERFRRLTSPAAAAGGALAQQGQQPGNQGNPTYAQ